jgi:arylsulfatase A-like enzyme
MSHSNFRFVRPPELNGVVKILFALLAVLFVLGSSRLPAQNAPPVPRNVILISWDGVDRAVLRELLVAKRLPNLAALFAEGSLQEMEVVGHATHTKPGHAEMLTGLAAETTGVITNDQFAPIPEGFTIFERLQQYFGRDKIRCIFVGSKDANVGGRGAGEIKPDPRKLHLPEYRESLKRGEPFHLTKKHLDLFDADTRLAPASVPLFLKAIEANQSPQFFAFLHLAEPDNNGHLFGDESAEYREGVVQCDEWLGKIVAWLKEHKLYDDTRIYISTDHGFDKGTKNHLNAPNIWLATNDKAVARGGNQSDIAATILWRFGVELEKLEPKLIGRPLTK